MKNRVYWVGWCLWWCAFWVFIAATFGVVVVMIPAAILAAASLAAIKIPVGKHPALGGGDYPRELKG